VIDTEKIVAECVELENKYGTLSFDKALLLFRAGWWKIADIYGLEKQAGISYWGSMAPVYCFKVKSFNY